MKAPMEASAETLPQHLRALEKAQRVRLAGAQLKDEVAAGTLSVGDALFDERAGSLAVRDLLMAQHRWGRQRTVKLLGKVSLRETKRVRELTLREKRLVAAKVAGDSEPSAAALVRHDVVVARSSGQWTPPPGDYLSQPL
jgi:hypothetical protein